MLALLDYSASFPIQTNTSWVAPESLCIAVDNGGDLSKTQISPEEQKLSCESFHFRGKTQLYLSSTTFQQLCDVHSGINSAGK